MFTNTSFQVEISDYQQFTQAIDNRDTYISVIGHYIKHDGDFVHLLLDGGDHQFNHKNSFFGYINKMYKGRIVCVKGERRFDHENEEWYYLWTLHAVNGTNC